MKDIIPATKRKLVYGWFAVIALALGSIQVGFASADLGQPVWLTVALSVFSFISAGVGYTAVANTEPVDSNKDSDETYGE